MGLLDSQGTHIKAVCDKCRVDAEVCCLREQGNAARRLAVEKLKRAGWLNDPVQRRDRYDGQRSAEGVGTARRVEGIGTCDVRRSRCTRLVLRIGSSCAIVTEFRTGEALSWCDMASLTMDVS